MDDTVARAIGHLDRLVAFNTTSDRPNRPLIAYVAQVLAESGIHAEVLSAPPGGSAGGGCAAGKAALIARFGPELPGGIVLSGHTDTVPVEGQTWSSDPFRLRQEGDRLYGRGTADMKGFIAAVLALAPVLARAPLARPLWLVLSYDEEVGCLAAPLLVPALLTRARRPLLAIVGEPSGMRIAPAHRGITTFTTTIVGRAGHSGNPAAGVNAIVAAAACIRFLDQLPGDLAAAGGPGEEGTTLNIGRISGGTAVNMIAGGCQFDWECRPRTADGARRIVDALASHVADTILPTMRAIAPEARITTEQRVAVPPLAVVDASILAWVQALTRSPETTVPFASEAGFFQQAGLAAVVCGPGEPAEAHQADEFVAMQQIDQCVTFLQRLAESPPPMSSQPAEGLASAPAVP